MSPQPSAPRNYPLLLAGQFLGAFGDNFLLSAILGPLTYAVNAGTITDAAVNRENVIYSLVNALPFILLAPLAGFLNDRMPKTRWLVGGNLVKLVGAFVGLAGVYQVGSANHLLQVAGYTVVGIGACLYSPAKYGILPEIVGNDRLVKANGMVEMLTLLAIVAGLGSGAILYDHTLSLPVCYVASVGLYAAALLFNFLMEATPFNPAASLSRSAGEFFWTLKSLVTNPRLGKVLLGSALFWFAGSAFKSDLQGWGLAVFAAAGVQHITNEKLVALKVGMAIGIALGAILAGRLHRTGDLSWARRYALLFAAGLAALGLLVGRLGILSAVAALVFTGTTAGLLLIPFNAALQSETDQTKLGKTVSVQNCTDYMGIASGAACLGVLNLFNLGPGGDLVAIGATVAAIALAMGFVTRKPAG